MDDDEETLFQPHHIKIMKVALALAIIRRKPEGVSGEEYTRRLSRQLGQLQTDWRKKAVHLERELLRTRQELVNCQVAKELNQQKESCEIYSQVDPVQTDCEWTSSGYSSSFNQDEPPETLKLNTCITLQDRKESGLSLAPGSHDNSLSDSGKEGEGAIQERIFGHVKFCSSVSAIMGVHKQLSDLVAFDLRANLHDTLIDAMKGLTEALECGGWSSSTPVQKLFIPAANSIVDCLQLWLLTPVLPDLTKACKFLISALVQHIVSKSSSPILCSVLVVLCGVQGVVVYTVEEIVKGITNTAQHLSDALNDVESLDVTTVESVGDLTCTLEELLTKYRPHFCSENERVRLVEKLESSVLGLIYCFPLYCYSVWRIVGHL
ncbi:meiosis-specific protein MEI4-like [Halichondria panicea]|uniref:meiosis-specific protein MEI4-like n=1 Tax=Halichondria panicea TaxID=6063 RepID=UPI00312B7F84